MRTRISLAIAAVLYGGTVMAGPAPLADSALDQVTAGTADQLQGSGGAVVGNHSEANLVLTGTLNLSDEAQSGARALNLVNSSESTVANGVNVWDGKLPEGAAAVAEAKGKFEVRQENLVQQEQRRVALLPHYERTDFNETSSWTENSTAKTSSATQSLSEIRDVQSSSSSRELSSSGRVDTQTTIVGQTIQGGRGIAGAADLDVNFDGGNIEFVANAGVGDVLEGELRLTLELPELQIGFSGGGCAVQMGSCEGNGTLAETSETSSDNTRLESSESIESSEKTFVGGGEKELRSPFYMADAQAEYVVVDDSKLDVESNYGIALAGSSQANLRALNAVNAAGSAVANAVNISRTPSLTAMGNLSLVQSNVIGHSR